jgi:Flp pilus assembly protein TadG
MTLKDQILGERTPIPRAMRKFRLLRAVRASVKESGSALVEMALAFPVYGAMIFGIIQFSIAIYAYDFLSNAAREGSRWAIVRGSQCGTNTPGLDHCGALQSDVQTYVQSLGYPFSGASTVNVSYLTATTGMDSSGNPVTTWAPCSGSVSLCAQPGNQVQVQIHATIPVGIPFWRAAQLTMGSTSSMVISQ